MEGVTDDIPEDEEELFCLYRKTGEQRIRDAIFTRYVGVVDAVARNYARSAEREDLLQVGYIGLLAAIERFDMSRGFRFLTYATHCVEGEIRHFLRDKTESIRRPRWMRKLSRRVAAFLEEHLQKNQRLPALHEISEALNISQEGVVAILRAKQPLSLESEGQPGGELPTESIRSLRHVSFQLPIEDRIAISEAFERLLDLERKVVYLFFVQDLTQKQIAGKLSLPPRKVSRLMQKALGRLRNFLEPEDVADLKRK